MYETEKSSCGKYEYCNPNLVIHCSNKIFNGWNHSIAIAKYAFLSAEPLRLVPDDVTDAETTPLQWSVLA